MHRLVSPVRRATDRILDTLVPRATATASICWEERHSDRDAEGCTNWKRTCCDWGNGRITCGNWTFAGYCW